MIVTFEFGNPLDTQPIHREGKLVHVNDYPTRQQLQTEWMQKGRDAWAYLHTSDDPLEVIVPTFEAMIPNYGCNCHDGYVKLKELHPFDMSSRDAFFVSTVTLHNAVNEKLAAAGDVTKRVVSLEEARQIWNRPASTE